MHELIKSHGQTERNGWRAAIRGNVLAMGWVSLFTDCSSEMLNPLLPIFLAGLVPLGWTAFYVGLMEGVAETAASLLKIFSGRISDRLGKRKDIVVIGYGASTAARPLIGLATAGWHVILLKFFDRIGKGLRTSPRDALIGDSVDANHRGLAFSFHRAMDHLGAVLGPVAAIGLFLWFVGPGDFERFGFYVRPSAKPPGEVMHAMRWLFLIALIPGIAAMAALIIKVREIAPQREAGEESAPAGWQGLPGRFYGLVAIVTIFALGNSSDLFILLLGNQLFGLGLVQILLLWIALHISKIVFSIPSGVLSDRFGRRGVLVAGYLIYAAVYTGFAVVIRIAQSDSTSAAYVWLFWLLVVIYGVYYGMTEGAEKALVTDFVASGKRGTAFGIYHGAIGLAALPASLCFGVFWSAIGPMFAFGIGAGLAALASVGLVILLSAGRHRG